MADLRRLQTGSNGPPLAVDGLPVADNPAASTTVEEPAPLSIEIHWGGKTFQFASEAEAPQSWISREGEKAMKKFNTKVRGQIQTGGVSRGKPAVAKRAARARDLPIQQADEQIRRTLHGLKRCRVCSCNHFHPCEPPCGWTEPDLCSNCAETVAVIMAWAEAAHRPNKTALWRELWRGKVL
jgi:hypothetical protein